MNTKFAVGAAVAGAFALGALVVAYSSAQQSAAPEEQTHSKPQPHVSTSFSELQEDEIREIIRSYLMTNPEVIIDAVNEYSARERQRQATLAKDAAAANLADLIDEKTSFIAGKNPAKAKIAVVEMYDYHCSFCKRMLPLIQELTEQNDDLIVVFRDLPILRDESDFAAAMSLAARDQGKAVEFHFELMNASGILTKPRIEELAKKIGLDVAKLEKTAKQAKVDAAIAKNRELAAQIGAEGTPMFIVAALDGSYVEVVDGARPQVLVETIEAARKAVKK